MSDFETWARELTEFFEDTARRTEVWAEHTLQGAVETADAIADDV